MIFGSAKISGYTLKKKKPPNFLRQGAIKAIDFQKITPRLVVPGVPWSFAGADFVIGAAR